MTIFLIESGKMKDTNQGTSEENLLNYVFLFPGGQLRPVSDLLRHRGGQPGVNGIKLFLHNHPALEGAPLGLSNIRLGYKFS